MAKTSYQDIPVEYKNLIKKTLVASERFIIPRVSVKKIISRKKILKGITQRSKLKEISEVWATLSAGQKTDWENVGLVVGLTSFKAFTKEYILRLQNSLSPMPSPSVYRHGKVGYIKIESPANNLTIQQDHPQKYYINKKVRGKRSMYEPALVTEYVSFPMTLKISYKSNLTTTSANNKHRIYIYIVSNYQGRDIETLKEINLDLITNWKTSELEITGIFGVFRYYKIVIEMQNVRGDFYFDNVKLYHSGKNWVRDTYCNDVHQDFTKAFYQVAKHWVADVIEDGANFESIYLD